MNIKSKSELEVLKYLNAQMPTYRKVLGRLLNFKKLLGGSISNYRAVASFADVESMDVSGNVGGNTIQSFTAPSKIAINKYAAVVFEGDTITVLEEGMLRLEDSVSPLMQKQAAKFRTMYEALIGNYNDAVEALSQIADEHLPTEASRYFKTVRREVQKLVGSKDLPTSVQVDFVGKDVVFAYYIDSSNFVSDNTRAYVVAVARLKNVGVAFTMTEEMAVYDRIIAGRSIRSKEVSKVNTVTINKMLSMHGVSLRLSHTDLGHDESYFANLFRNHPQAREVSVDGTELNIQYEGAFPQFERDAVLLLRKDATFFRYMKKTKTNLKYKQEGRTMTFWLEG